MAVDVRRLENAWQLTLVATDRPGLFATVAGTLASFGMNILKAEAFANRRGTWCWIPSPSPIRSATWT